VENELKRSLKEVKLTLEGDLPKKTWDSFKAELYHGNEKLTDLNLSKPEASVKEANFNLKISFQCPRCNSKNVYINAKTKEVVYCSDCKYFDRESQGRVFKFEKDNITK